MRLVRPSVVRAALVALGAAAVATAWLHDAAVIAVSRPACIYSMPMRCFAHERARAERVMSKRIRVGRRGPCNWSRGEGEILAHV